MSLLAGQGIEKAQNLEGAQQAMAELEEFFGKKISRVPVIAESVSANLEVQRFLTFVHFKAEASFFFMLPTLSVIFANFDCTMSYILVLQR